MKSITNSSYIDKLVAVGLSKYEALGYLALLEKNNTTALDIVGRSGIPRQRIYDILDSLQAKGLCVVKNGRPRRYIGYKPEQALTALSNYHKQQQAAENKRQARLIREMLPALNDIIPDAKSSQISVSPQSNDNVDTYRDIGGL